jgi:hypothetical protein
LLGEQSQLDQDDSVVLGTLNATGSEILTMIAGTELCDKGD